MMKLTTPAMRRNRTRQTHRRHDLDPLDQTRRDLVQVRGDAMKVYGEPARGAAVDQDQGTVRTESTQIGGGNTARVAQAAGAVAQVLTQRVIVVLRKQLNEVGKVGSAVTLDIFRIKHLDRLVLTSLGAAMREPVR